MITFCLEPSKMVLLSFDTDVLFVLMAGGATIDLGVDEAYRVFSYNVNFTIFFQIFTTFWLKCETEICII